MQKRLTNYYKKSEDGSFAGMTVAVFKPKDWTSFDVVNKLRGVTRVKKVGHAGTLDPFAEGVLVLGFGAHTKLLNENRDKVKEYKVEIRFGAETDTQDSTGQVVKSSQVDSPPTLEELQAVCREFTGTINQIPPMYSAKKVKGKRLYKLAREGKVIERDPVQVTIHSCEIVSYEWPSAVCSIVCGPGTYIRTLAADMGRSLGCGAYANTLLRTRVGDFTIDDCFEIEEFAEEWKSITVS